MFEFICTAIGTIFIIYIFIFAFNYDGKDTFKKKPKPRISKPYPVYRTPPKKNDKLEMPIFAWHNEVDLNYIGLLGMERVDGMTKQQWIASHAMPKKNVLHLNGIGKYRDYLNSPRWKLIISLIRNQYGSKCQACGSIHNLNVHHTTYAFVYHEIENSYTLMLLCNDCHFKIDHKPIMDTWPGNQ